MSDIERQRRLKAIADILSRPDTPRRLRLDLEEAREELTACVAAQDSAARAWRGAADRAMRRRSV